MIGCIIQARMGSSRLPGKVMKKINNEIPMLKFQMNQLKFSKYIDKIIIATTTLENDDFIVSFCEQNNIEHFRGSSKDVLGRYYNCSRKFRLPTIVRITSDNPLIDPEIVDDVINEFQNSEYDYISTENEKTFPLGFAVEIFNFKSLEKAWTDSELPSEREHVTPYIIKNKTLFNQKNYSYKQDMSHLRCTVDTQDDFNLIEKIIQKIDSRPIHLMDVLRLGQNEPDLFEINSHVKHDGMERSLKEDEEFLNNNS